MRDPKMRGVGGGSGPGRWVLIVGGISTVVLVLVLLGGAASVPRMLEWGLSATRDRVLAAVAADTTPYQRRQLRRSFDCVVRAALEGGLSEDDLGALSRTCNEALADRKLTEQERQAIIAVLLRLCPREGGP